MLCRLLALALAISPAFAAEVLLEDFALPQEAYPHTVGGEFPGARAALDWAEEGHLSTGALRIAYDFTRGGRYCQWAYSGWLPDSAASVSFYAQCAKGARVILRAVDDTGQYHQFGVTLATDDWQPVAVPLDGSKTIAHWGGANDAAIHQPLKTVFIGPESTEAERGVLLIDSVAVETATTEGEALASRRDHFMTSARLTVSSREPGLLFRAGEPSQVRLSVRPVPPGIDNLLIRLSWSDADASPVDGLPAQVALSRDRQFAAAIPMPTEPGYYEARYTIGVSGAHQEADTTRRFSLGLIPDHPEEEEPDSPFGVNTHFNQGWPPELAAIVKRAGIGWIRDGEASLEDRALPAARAQNLCYMPCFTWYRRPLDEHRKPHGAYDFTEVADWHREYARKFGAHIDAYDLVNEPHGPWSEVLGGDWSGGPWQDVFVEYGRAVTEAIKASDPRAVVLWEDIDQLLWYRRFYELGAGDLIDAISPHPYNMHRSRSLPEEQPILEQLPEFRAYAAEHDLTWEVWSGEVGFSSFTLTEDTATAFYTPVTELEQARMLVRMMVSQLAGGVGRIFWYDFCDDGTERHNPEHNFGIIRHDRTPKPAVVAYSHMIHRLRGCQWLGRRAIGGGADAYAFLPPGATEPMLVAWLRRGTKAEQVRVLGDAGSVNVTDIFGVSKDVPVVDGRLLLELSETPVYVEGLALPAP